MSHARPYMDSDKADVLRVWEASARWAYPFCGEAFFDKNRADIADVFLPRCETTVWVDNGDIVGFIAMLGNTVGGLFVDPASMRHGIGRSLLEHAARTRTTMDLTVFEKNASALRFYRRFGFEEDEQKEIEPESGEPLLRLTWARS